MILKLFRVLAICTIGLALAGVASAAPKGKGLKRHALAKVALAPVTVVKYSPKAALMTAKVAGKGFAYTIGGIAFAAESGVDVVHLATDVLDKGVAAEGWKKNFFHYPNVVVGYADSGLEDLYQTFFGLKI